MNPIYKFELSTFGGESQIANPVYSDGVTKDYEKESGQQFFRAKLNGKLVFKDADYNLIVDSAFDEQFFVQIFISYNFGQTYQNYWKGTFFKTDCEFDNDTKTVTVNPSVYDQYNDVLAGLEREYNLIDLLPKMAPVSLDKRPMIQVYVPGQSVIGCFLSGMWWEQECEPVSDESKLVEIGNDKLNFALNQSLLIGDISGNTSPTLPEMLTGNFAGSKFNLLQIGTQEFNNGTYILRYFNSGQGQQIWSIVRASDSMVLWQSLGGGQFVTELPITVSLQPVSGSGATGTIELYLHEIVVYARYICDVPEINGQQTYEIPIDDLVENNRNYKRVIGYGVTNVIFFSTALSVTPTKWGIYQPDKYYQQPYVPGINEFIPVARAGWGRISIWFAFAAFDAILMEPKGRASFTLKDAFLLSSVISVLLEQFAPGIIHERTTDYSEFLYGSNPISGIVQTLLITPKTNLMYSGYDQPAQQAKITLKDVLNMLRDCFRCYWFIDELGRFRIEHISFFMRGGSYYGSPVIGIDLTSEFVTRNSKPWSFARNQYSFEKPEMAARYEFGWMDDVTQLFDGFPIDIISKYVNPDNIEKIDVSKFTSDVDYILLNPGDISKDGFVLLSATRMTYAQGEPFVEIQPSNPYKLPVWWKIGEFIEINFSAAGQNGTPLAVSFVDSFDNLIKTIGNIVLTNTQQTITFGPVEVPQNAAKLQFSIPNGSAAVQVISIFGGYTLPYYNFVIDYTDHYLQNAYVAFAFLYQYYLYDLPASKYRINGVDGYAFGTKKLKIQSLKFPTYMEPDLLRLIKTNLGNGLIKKLSVNLSSRNANATLTYDTE